MWGVMSRLEVEVPNRVEVSRRVEVSCRVGELNRSVTMLYRSQIGSINFDSRDVYNNDQKVK